MKIIIINGPNLNLLGKREPELYGYQSMETYLEELRAAFPDVELEYYQSNHEGDLIDKLQQVGFSYDGIILNPAAYTHTSIAIADAVAAITTPVVEVHITDPKNREEFRHISYVEAYCVQTFAGYGLEGYRKALEFQLDRST